ncbi:putative extracellular SCP domain protein Pry1 [Aspergillus ibericus CBS 121593]|uniref:PR-1-like protein n=1 Tax=Aspergillus ibericus CBS 121593 TaxID=1448316 RepID=A0A395H5N4_9EURO|nr:PR-1-like protein [Aspergillus ibericus CBS 121593]RAL02445.1 PR-1-like protein [Aspergillus ibericus CBS 121593]
MPFHPLPKILLKILPNLLTITIITTLLSALVTAQQQQHTTIIITVTATPTTPPNPPSYTSPALFQNSILNVTNTYRNAHNASNLTWNTTLTEYAQSWAEQCKWQHSNGPYGENLAFGYPNTTTSICAWGDESQHYDFKLPTGFSEETGHFTQLVWRATRQVGCAAVDCGLNGTRNASTGEFVHPQGWFLVCEYAPRGNVMGGDRRWGDKEFFRINVQEGREYNGPDVTGSESSADGGWRGRRRGWLMLWLWWWVGVGVGIGVL